MESGVELVTVCLDISCEIEKRPVVKISGTKNQDELAEIRTLSYKHVRIKLVTKYILDFTAITYL